MAADLAGVDFLIITALPEETNAVNELLEERRELVHEVVGKVSRKGSVGSYSVALSEVGEMGTNAAQAATREALIRQRPSQVILTGIAAGFPETGVALGDVMVPYAIVPYELGKVKQQESGVADQGGAEVEHRGIPLAVSYGLWHAANLIAQDKARTWANQMKVRRPDGTETKPGVQSRGGSILGSGEKVVATELAEARRWLLEKFPRSAIGLEMESWGALWACRSAERPFLVVKACQDAGTSEKDTQATKDLWRLYAAEAAAAFTVALIERFEHSELPLIQEHMKDVGEVAAAFERDLPKPAFTYFVSRAESYEQLRSGAYSLTSQNISCLIPNDTVPGIVLHGGGGTGKTTIVRELLGPLVDSGLCPVLLELGRFAAWREFNESEIDNEAELLRGVMQHASVPRRKLDELGLLAARAKLTVVVDGLNEVSRRVRASLIGHLRRLHAGGNCYILVTDRFGPAESLETFAHCVVDRLDLGSVRVMFDAFFGQESFGRLASRLQQIYRRPFFLSLALRTKQKFAGKNLWSAIFEEFFVHQLHLSRIKLDKLAEHTFRSFGPDGGIDIVKFQSRVGGRMFPLLSEAEVLSKERGDFEHHLWRDYLVARYLAGNRRKWRDSAFDVATTFSSSLESLSLVVEQLPNREQKDAFLKAVFDWNYVAAADCIADFKEGDPERRQLSRDIRAAILAAISEKRFDAVERTRRRAETILRDHGYEFANPFVESATHEDLVRHVSSLGAREEWFRRWKALFVKRKGEGMSLAEVGLIEAEDSLIGWAASNVARRMELDDKKLGRVRAIYRRTATSSRRRSIRWRTVHVLGAYPGHDNVSFLLNVLKKDPYHWAQYGAVRALVEIASRSEPELRREVISRLLAFIKGYDPGNDWVRRQVLREILETAFIRSPNPGWKIDVHPVLELVVEQENDPSYKEELRRRLSDFDSYEENSLKSVS